MLFVDRQQPALVVTALDRIRVTALAAFVRLTRMQETASTANGRHDDLAVERDQAVALQAAIAAEHRAYLDAAYPRLV